MRQRNGQRHNLISFSGYDPEDSNCHFDGPDGWKLTLSRALTNPGYEVDLQRLLT